ncbi:MAG TPA: hypothetical protein RMH85_32370 [Polyangiaceae bacterium LLY-WYZ-15_(1-7)]|nr:hypothetical protein [Sandaracinus sp.]HJL04855.1 hypothetical protein [Polyangiaceae bacterium LLY-WYZ-15_(1-7)]HJL13224.1 hypothetical protein [Polyangiaceae bacterium LLY-WYZ-15_(1-7)]HJL23682.1 hypothetical protein [Polyangiaceae bacterium LLY-WYZ-15_(1-7)]HJL33388.1 hypothetical protein [Polyangiaceae bacterium LLY-WYZ-15_(1-7)]
MKRRLLTFVAITTLASLSVFAVSPADAVSTRHFTLDDADDLAAGELDGTMVLDSGQLAVGVGVARVELEGAVLSSAIARADDGTLYLGTGDAGQIFRVRGDQVEVFAETGQLLVSSLALAGDTLYAGTLPEGRVFAIDRGDGSIRELAQLEGAEHVWDLHWDAGQSRLFAATGPEGKVFAIDPQGRSEVYFDAEDGHVLCLAADGDALYAGTDGDAVVYRLRGPERAEVVHDFPGNEVTALAARDGMIAVAANEMPAPRRVTSKNRRSKAASRTPRPGKGRLWRVDADGRAERLHRHDDGHFTALAIDEDGTILVGEGKEGRILRVGPYANAGGPGTAATWVDVDERQVLAIDVGGDRPVFVTGDSAALYRVTEAAPDEALWTSKVLDAEFRARWGRLDWRGRGRVQFQTRSGNTEEPDASWTEWSANLSSPGPIRSPAARFLQIRARLMEGDALIRAVQAYYLPQNQRARVTGVGPKLAKNHDPNEIPDPSTELELDWDVSNPDDDTLRYRLRYRAEAQDVWRPMFREDERLTKSSYEWDTSGLPDGWYVVQVEASDELANPAPLALRTTAVSEPIRIDNHPPRLEGLAARGNTVSGRAIDGLGPIARLEMAVDGGDWLPILPEDQLLDQAEERFAVPVEDLEPGSHIVAIRATDAAGNAVSGEVVLRERRTPARR